jgi:hypothetical protein
MAGRASCALSVRRQRRYDFIEREAQEHSALSAAAASGLLASAKPKPEPAREDPRSSQEIASAISVALKAAT